MGLLHEAIKDWNDEQIAWLLEHQADVNEFDEEGNTPLMLAVRNDIYSEQVQQLLRRGANLHAKDRAGKTPWMLSLDYFIDNRIPSVLLEHYAILGEQPEVDPSYEQGRLALLAAIHNEDVQAVSALLDAGVDPNARNQQGRTALMLAVEQECPEIVSLLLERGADVHARETEENNWTALHVAADSRSSPECARILLEYGAEVDTRDNAQWTPLMWAAHCSAAPLARLLLEYGADVHAESAEGGSALGNAAWIGNRETIQTLLDWGAGVNTAHLQEALSAAFLENNHDKAPLFIQMGAKVGLYEAIQMRDRSLINRLLKAGVETSELNKALVAAAAHAEPDIVRLLLRHGADPNGVEAGSQTALMQVIWNPWDPHKIVTMLLKAGADVNARDSEGGITFCLVWRYTNPLLLRRMLERGAEIDAQGEAGRTCLMDAVWRGESETVKLLLKHGANADIQDDDGNTALLNAVSRGHQEIIRLLLEHGASVHLRNAAGRTALAIARRWIGKGVDEQLIQAGAQE